MRWLNGSVVRLHHWSLPKKNPTAYGKDPDCTLLAEKNWMLAHLFMDGANKKTFGNLLKNMNNDHPLGTKEHPKDVETALQMMMMLCSEGANKKTAKEKRCKQVEDKPPS